jgi:ABC-type maltose transport system permease subunit
MRRPVTMRPSTRRLSSLRCTSLGLLNNLGGLVLFYATFNAGAVIAMIPCGIVYVSLQRYYVRGLVSGALTG